MSNVTKTIRQKGIVTKWLIDRVGTLIAATGFGKTITALMAAREIQAEDPTYKIIVIVPSVNLKTQWEEQLISNGIRAEVIIINTAYKNTYKCDLLILDEVHKYGADQFVEVFNAIEYRWIFCLTATIWRSDGKHQFLVSKAPIIDEVTISECLQEGWVSQFKTYNFSVPFTPTEHTSYYKVDKQFKYAASQLGFGGESFRMAQTYLKDANATNEQKSISAMYMNAMRKRKELVINAVNKITAVEFILKKFSDRKSLIFSESKIFADKITARVGSECRSYYSGLKPKELKAILEEFSNPEGNVRVLSSAKALNEGTDVPDCSLGIIAAGNSVKGVGDQRRGRMLRAQPGKVALLFNLYIPDTQDEVWLKRRTLGEDVQWVSTIKEIDIL
jgi:superfamily II DNA or RNA helicase